MMGLTHESHIPEAQVPEPSVDELRRRARRGAAEIARVDECDGQPGASSVRSGGSTDDAAADDEQIELMRREPLDRPRAVGMRR